MPLDLNQSESETAQFAQMAAEEPIVEAPAPAPAPTPEKVAEPAADPATPAVEPPAAAPDPVADDPDKGKPNRQVDLRALLEERGKRKETQTKLEEAMAELSRLRGGQQPAAPQQQEPAEVDHETDPIAALGLLRREMAELRQGKQQETQMGEFQRTVVTKEAEYMAANPDYPKAIEFLKEARVRELRDGLGLSDAEIGQALANEAAQTAQYALSRDLNPAEVFARMATAKGYKAEAPKAEAQAPATKLATIAAGQRVAKGLSSAGGGGAPSAVPTLESIANMSAVEQEAFWKNGTMKSLMQ